MTDGPPLEHMLRRLAATPDDFLAEPRIGETGQVATAALVGDLFQALGFACTATDLDAFAGRSDADRNRSVLIAIVVWLLADDWIAAAKPAASALLGLLRGPIVDLAAVAKAHAFIVDVERREELARITLAALGMVPAGESAAQAKDRLSAVSAVERRRLLRASQQAEARARAIREALVRKAAEESADKYGRE